MEALSCKLIIGGVTDSLLFSGMKKVASATNSLNTEDPLWALYQSGYLHNAAIQDGNCFIARCVRGGNEYGE